jgi:hypothetical protein
MFRNVGEADLRIEAVGTSCACTQAGVETATLKPGEASVLQFSINIGPSVGDVRERVFVYSNDPRNSNVVLTLRLHVLSRFEVVPPVVRLGDIPPGSKTNLTVMVHRTDGQKLRITKLESDNPLLKARAVPAKESKNHSAQIQIAFQADDNPGPFEDTLYVHTGEMYAEDLPKPSFEISLKGRVAKPTP